MDPDTPTIGVHLQSHSNDTTLSADGRTSVSVGRGSSVGGLPRAVPARRRPGLAGHETRLEGFGCSFDPSSPISPRRRGRLHRVAQLGRSRSPRHPLRPGKLASDVGGVDDSCPTRGDRFFPRYVVIGFIQ